MECSDRVKDVLSLCRETGGMTNNLIRPQVMFVTDSFDSLRCSSLQERFGDSPSEASWSTAEEWVHFKKASNSVDPPPCLCLQVKTGFWSFGVISCRRPQGTLALTKLNANAHLMLCSMSSVCGNAPIALLCKPRRCVCAGLAQS